MEINDIIQELNELIKENKEKILPTKWRLEGVIGAQYRVDGAIYAGWHTKALSFLKTFLSDGDDYIEKFTQCSENTFSKAQAATSILENLIIYIEKGYIKPEIGQNIDIDTELKRIFSHFHRIVKQLRKRHDGRPTLDVSDEYDVQDLLHALLRLYFDDIRAEEWTPSYAGKSARMDFLLKKEKTVIEIKMTRKGLTNKELGDQLIVDIKRYQSHPDCDHLICFVYDPEGRINNPTGIVNDLVSKSELNLSVFIEPSD